MAYKFNPFTGNLDVVHSISYLDGLYVNVTGDTMTGPLLMSFTVTDDDSAGDNRYPIHGQSITINPALDNSTEYIGGEFNLTYNSTQSSYNLVAFNANLSLEAGTLDNYQVAVVSGMNSGGTITGDLVGLSMSVTQGAGSVGGNIIGGSFTAHTNTDVVDISGVQIGASTGGTSAVTNLYGQKISMTKGGSSTVDYQYGIYIGEVTGALYSNYGIFSQSIASFEVPAWSTADFSGTVFSASLIATGVFTGSNTAYGLNFGVSGNLGGVFEEMYGAQIGAVTRGYNVAGNNTVINLIYGIQGLTGSFGDLLDGVGNTTTVNVAKTFESFNLLGTNATITSAYGYYYRAPLTISGGAITTEYGIYLEDVSFGSTKYAIVTNAGNIVFNEGGDPNTDLRVEGDTDTELLLVDASDNAVKIGSVVTSKVGFYGITPVVQSSAYTPSNVTTDRTYDANVTTINELADILGSLISDLKLTGIIG